MKELRKTTKTAEELSDVLAGVFFFVSTSNYEFHIGPQLASA
jgi:hypothetical protein